MLFSDPEHSPAATLPAQLRDYPEWHRGRARYGLWLIPVEDPQLLAHIRTLQHQLADLLHPSPQRQPHLTLFVCGFEQPLALADDDFTPLQLQQQIDRLGQAPGSAFCLPLGRPESFASAAFVPVGDPDGRLRHWRKALGQVCGEVRQAPYIPHITLGLYRRTVDAEVIRRRLESLDAPELPLKVRQLHYATYCARTQFGPLQSHHRLRLEPAG